MKYVFTLILGLFILSAQGQEINKKLEDQIKHKQIMLNQCSREGLVSFPEFKDSYNSAAEKINERQKSESSFRYVVRRQ